MKNIFENVLLNFKIERSKRNKYKQLYKDHNDC